MLRILFLVLLVSQVSAQGIKIGDIEIPVDIAKEYFVDLYIHPDTVRYTESYNSVKGHTLKKKAIAEWYGDRFGKVVYRPKGISNQTWHFMRIDTTKFVTPEGHYDPLHNRIYNYYAFPRKPTASDFAKWFRKRK